MDMLIESFRSNAHDNGSKDRLIKELSQKEQQKASIEHMKLSLYSDWKNGDISAEEYRSLLHEADKQMTACDGCIGLLQEELQKNDDGVCGGNAFLARLAKYRNMDRLTRDVLVELVEAIYVHEGGEMTVQFRFSDIFG